MFYVKRHNHCLKVEKLKSYYYIQGSNEHISSFMYKFKPL